MKKVELALLVAFGFFIIAIAAPSWARTTLENQSLEAQCRYKATVTESIVSIARNHDGPMNIGINYDHETTPAEKALVQQYIAEARQYASRYATTTPEEAKMHMFNLCMGFVKVGSAEPPEGIRLPPVGELPELNYHHEWCWNLGSDARLIIQALKNRMPPDQIHMNIESVDYFSPQRKLSAHNLVNSAAESMKANEESPGQWFKRVTSACMAEAHGG